jgi:hypothetical protein
MIKFASIVSAALLVSGCMATQASWEKSGATATQTASDVKVCEYEAHKSGLGTGSRRNPFGSGFDEMLNIKQLESLCMQSRGYTRAE